MNLVLAFVNDKINTFLHNVYVQYNRLDSYLSAPTRSNYSNM